MPYDPYKGSLNRFLISALIGAFIITSACGLLMSPLPVSTQIPAVTPFREISLTSTMPPPTIMPSLHLKPTVIPTSTSTSKLEPNYCLQPGENYSPLSARQRRLKRLSTGVNITQWFRFPSEETAEYFHNYISDEDLDLIVKMGYTHVRLAIALSMLYQPKNPQIPNPEIFGYVDAAIDRFLSHGLAVVISIHDEDKLAIEYDPKFQEGFSAFWDTLAGYLCHRDPEWVFFEVINEPAFENHPADWAAIQETLIRKIRSVAPQHTLIASGPLWSGINGLQYLTPLDDVNIIYTIHFYEPFPFTHQGADWVDAGYVDLRDLPYPNDSQKCASIIHKITNPETLKIAQGYCGEQWNQSKLEARFIEAAAWAQKYRVPIWVGEFGIYPKDVPPEDRLQWFRDVLNVLNHYHWGWAVWGYDDEFGLGRRLDNDGKIIIDEGIANILNKH